MRTKENKGITLIALVLTIIVLIILTGVSISMLTGQNGILDRTKDAKETTKSASDLEYLQTKAYEAITNYYANGENGVESEFILKELGKIDGIVTKEANGLINYNGKTYDISDIIGATSEQKNVENQTDVKLKRITVATATKSEDIALFSTGKIRLIIREENEETNCAPIPNGFYYVAGAPSTGLVISDKFGDDDQNSKGGNQFVWVPCTGKDGATYEKKNGLASTWKEKYPTYEYSYSNYSDWKDEGGDTASVDKYGGFYIARYEAGVPSNARFYANSGGDTYADDKNPLESEIIGVNEKNLTDEEREKKLLPVSKKNTQCWNEITYVNAEKLAKSMYFNSDAVYSNLVDGYAWDTIIEWASKDSKYDTVDNGVTYKLGKNSTKFGNYANNYDINLSNALYAVHRYGWKSESGKEDLIIPFKYSRGNFTSGKESIDSSKYKFEDNVYLDGYEYDIRKELATGASEVTKINNIYDMAGNMWEMTTEYGKHGKTGENDDEFGILRGGGFFNARSLSNNFFASWKC